MNAPWSWPVLRGDIMPNQARWRGTVRTLAAVMLVIVVGFVTRMDEIYWAVLTVAVLAQPLVASSIQRMAMRIVGTAVGAVVAVGIAAAFLGNPPAYFGAVMLCIAVGTYLWASSAYSYAFLIFAATVAIVAFTAVLNPENTMQVAWHRAQEITLGVVGAGVASAVLWPDRARDALLRSHATKLRRAARALGPVRQPESPHPGFVLAIDPPPDEQFVAQLGVLDLAASEDPTVWERREVWFEFVATIERIRIVLDEAGRGALQQGAAEVVAPVRPELEAVAKAIEDECIALAAALHAGLDDGETNPLAAEEVHAAVRGAGPAEAALQARMAAADVVAVRRAWPMERVARQFSVVRALTSATEDLVRARMQAAEILQPARYGYFSLGLLAQVGPAFGVWPLQPRRLMHAFKTSLAVGICMVIALTLQWNLGVAAMMTCVLLSAVPNLGAFVQKGTLRLAGSVLGAGAGIVTLILIVPNVETAGGLLLATAPILALFAYILWCGSRVNYIGMQALVTFGIVVVPTAVPTADMWPGVSRVLGVLLGTLIVGGVFRYISPVFAIDGFRLGMARLARGTGDLITHVLAASAPGGADPAVHLAGRRDVYAAVQDISGALRSMEFDGTGDVLAEDAPGLPTAPLAARLFCRRALAMVQLAGALPPAPPPAVARATAAVLAALRDEAMAVAARWVAPEPAQTLAAIGERAAALQAFDAAVEAERASTPAHGWTIRQAEAFYSQVEHIHRMCDQMDHMWADAQRFGPRGTAPAVPPPGTPPAPPPDVAPDPPAAPPPALLPIGAQT